MNHYPHSPFRKHPQLVAQLFRNVNTEYLKELQEWLCLCPKITTIRVNLLKTTRQAVQQLVMDKLKSTFTATLPLVSAPNIFPELLVIRNGSPVVLLPDQTLNEIVVDACCGAALLRGAHIYAPGVLAMQTNSKLNEMVNVFADLDGKCLKGTATKYASATKTFIGMGLIKMQRYQLFGENLSPEGIAVEMISTVSGVPSIGDAYLPNGIALLQNFPSIVCGRVLNPQPGDTVLDMCAAPGNKTTHLGELMQDDGILIALDKNLMKLKQLNDNTKPYGLKNLHCFAFDSTKSLKLVVNDKLPHENAINILNGPPFEGHLFDKILLDAPCSALGLRPQLSNTTSERMLKSFDQLQKKLFTNAVGLLKVHGVLVYSTCSIAQVENEDLVSWAIETFPCIELVPATPILGSPGIEGSDLNEAQKRMVQRFGPECTEWDSVGFFIAKFIKTDKSPLL